MKQFTIFLLFFISFGSYGQSSNISSIFVGNFRKAEALFNQNAYRNALQLYLHVVDKDPGNLAARQRIADCYFRLGNAEEAEKWYGALAKQDGGDARNKYQYAQILSLRGNYAEARKWFVAYRTAVPEDTRSASKVKFIDNLHYYTRDSSIYEIRNQPYNSDQSDFSPQYYRDGVVFVSARNRDLFVKRQSFSALNDDEAMLNVFFASAKAANEKDAELFYKKELNSPYHDGPVAFFQSGKRVVFSRSNLKGGRPVASSGRVNLELYFAVTNEQNKLQSLEAFPFNDDSYSIGHPWISEDGNTLYFASDMPGGQGGTDLYKTTKQNGKWLTPSNPGSPINTPGDEFYPFLMNDSTFYFSSDGHGGMGGQDIFSSTIRNAAYSIPVNLGFPLNTRSDDFSGIVDTYGRNGLFASNRSGGLGYDDIYSFRVKSYFIQGRVVNRSESTQGIADAKIVLKDKTGHTLDSLVSDSTGRFSFDLLFDADYSFAAAKNGYSWIDTLSFSTRGKLLGRDSLLIPLWPHSLFAKGIIYSNESQGRLSNATVTIENLKYGTLDSILTNESGSYSFPIEPGKKYQITVSKKGFLPREIHLNTKNIFHGDLLNDMLLEEEFVDKVVIQFAFDSDVLRPSEFPLLERMHKDLNRRKHVKLRINAFADSHGTVAYNQSLSDLRAMAVLKYFTSRGVDRRRVEAVGFGEALLLNQCSDGVECDEEEHSKNRRAELKVQLEN